MFGDWIHRLTGTSRKETPQEELFGLANKFIENDTGGGLKSNLYYLLEEEKIPREVWPWVLAYITRSAKLTNLDDKDIEYLRWKIMAHVARIQLEIDNILPKPEYFPSLEDYRKYISALRLLPHNLEQFMLFVIKRSHLGFERRLQATRTVYIGYPEKR